VHFDPEGSTGTPLLFRCRPEEGGEGRTTGYEDKLSMWGEEI